MMWQLVKDSAKGYFEFDPVRFEPAVLSRRVRAVVLRGGGIQVVCGRLHGCIVRDKVKNPGYIWHTFDAAEPNAIATHRALTC